MKRLINQRVRNRIIEYLLGVSEYETDPGVCDLNDVINDWEMSVSHPFSPADFPSPTYTSEEISALQTVDAAWSGLCDTTPQTITDERVALASPEWLQFVDEARAALEVFMQRGKLSEDNELGS